MRLINVNTLQLEEFMEGSIPKYAILSHRWTGEELTFKEVAKSRIDKSKSGYQKFLKSCQITKEEHGLDYLWNDTCCIDKRSSAELSEAINSMCAWYRDSKVCLAYLQDVKERDNVERTFAQSVWFRRAWTLQELLAPSEVLFYSGEWKLVGDKKTQASTIQNITGIDKSALLDWKACLGFSIVTKMSWAARRKATRTEDVSYSLLGLFDINMPLVYGEGGKAFSRLQHEIIRHGEGKDLSFLVSALDQKHSRLLASSPDDFVRLDSFTPMTDARLYNTTSTGLEMDLELFRWCSGVYGVPLGVFVDGTWLYLLFQRLYEGFGGRYSKIGFGRYDGSNRPMFGANMPLWKRLTILWGPSPIAERTQQRRLPDRPRVGIGRSLVIDQTGGYYPHERPGRIDFEVSVPEGWSLIGYSTSSDDSSISDLHVDLDDAYRDIKLNLDVGGWRPLCITINIDVHFDAYVSLSKAPMEQSILHCIASREESDVQAWEQHPILYVVTIGLKMSQLTDSNVNNFYMRSLRCKTTFAHVPRQLLPESAFDTWAILHRPRPNSAEPWRLELSATPPS